MSKKMKKILFDIEAKAKVTTVALLMIIVALSAMFVMLPQDSITVSAAEVGQFVSHKDITLDHNQVPSTLTNFPVLINLSSDAQLASDALDSGWDIAFFDSGNTQLSHEIELFDGATGKLVAWVNVTSLSSSSDTTISMYYGDSDIGSSAENIAGTWGNNYYMVMHMDNTDDGANDSLNIQDFEERVPMEVDDYHQTGIAGYATKFDGGGTVEDNSECIGTTINFMTTDDWENSWVMEYWVTIPNRNHDHQRPLFFGDTCNIYHDYFNDSGVYKIRFSANDEADTNPDIFHTYTMDTTSFYYMVHRHNSSASNLSAFINGVYFGGISQNDFHNGPNGDSCLGAGYTIHSWGIDSGKIDEFRLAKTPHSDDWIKTTYNSINNATNGSFFTLGGGAGGGSGTYETSGLTSGDFTWSCEAGNTVWANATGTGTETMNVYTNTSGTSDNCTDIFFDFSDFGSQLYDNNLSIEVKNSSSGAWDGNTHQITEADGNVTINSAMWDGANWCHGTNPFPIVGYNSTILVRLKIEVHAGVSAATYTNSTAWNVLRKVIS